MIDALTQAISIITILLPRLLLPIVVAEPNPVIYSPPVAVVDQMEEYQWRR